MLEVRHKDKSQVDLTMFKDKKQTKYRCLTHGKNNRTVIILMLKKSRMFFSETSKFSS